jgi:alpha-mannosidase
LLRSPTWPDPDADRGHHHFSYALFPHAGNWKDALTVRQGYDFNYKLQAMQVAAHDGKRPSRQSLVTVKPENVVLTALKKSEDGDALILRFYEWAGKNADVQINLPAGASSATLTNLMEQPEGSLLSITKGGQLTVPIHPYEIQSVRIDYPQAAKLP